MNNQVIKNQAGQLNAMQGYIKTSFGRRLSVVDHSRADSVTIRRVNPLKRYSSGQLLGELMRRNAISWSPDGQMYIEDDL